MTLLALENLTVTQGAAEVVRGVSLQIQKGEFIGLIGPNGAGKTSLMRAALGLIAHDGTSSLSALDPAQRARQVAFLPQHREIAWPMQVAEVVALGRVPHLAGRVTAQDSRAVDAALQRLDLQNFAMRDARKLSGGEQARMLIARALAQETPLILADEPAAGLDPEHQIRAMQLFADLAAEGRGVMASVHDLGLAARFCTRLVMLDRGRVVADGPPLEVLSEARLAEVFGIRALRLTHAGEPVIVPLSVVRHP